MSKIVKIQWGYLFGKRARHAGCNARLGNHGVDIREPYTHITLDDGTTGFGFARITQAEAETFLGQTLDDLVSVENGTRQDARVLDFALWDVLGQREGKPIYQLLDPMINKTYRVPCYDTSLYIDDLHLDTDEAAADLVAGHARQGYERGHRAFKIKVGRGAIHMELDAGNQRDIAVIRAVREAVGDDCKVMIDANNGYNFNITKHILAETADCNLHWIEEPFHEDAVLYGMLQEGMQDTPYIVWIADGEGHAHPHLMQWAKDGIVNVIQYDLRQHGFSTWLDYGKQLDEWNVQSAPHNYGSAFGEYASCHLAAGIEHFEFVESDVIHMDGLDASGYELKNGRITVPDKAGFGLSLDVDALQEGYTVSA